MCAGTSVGGWRIIRTVGNKIFRMQPVNGLAADLNSSLIIFSATMLHLPVSTTHVVTGSIMGVGWRSVSARSTGVSLTRWSRHGS